MKYKYKILCGFLLLQINVICFILKPDFIPLLLLILNIVMLVILMFKSTEN